MWQHYKHYFKLMRFHQPIGICLLLWPTLWGVWAAANGKPSLKIICIFVLGSIVMRAAGCVINDIADRQFDGHVKRTSMRPLANKHISVLSAVIVFFICITLGLALTLMLNRLAITLAFIGLALTIVYPFTKRWIHTPQLILGFAFAWGIPMAYAAIQEKLTWECWYLFTLVILLAIAYDTLYAMVDKEDDMKIGIKSTAIWFGQYDKTIIFVLQLIVWLGLLLFGFLKDYSLIFDGWIVCSLGFFIYQRKLIQTQTTQKYFQAFLNHHWFALWVWIGFVIYM